MPSDYRFAPALLVRSFGGLLALCGLVVLVVAGVVALAGGPGGAVTTAAAVSAALIILGVVAVAVVARGAPLVRLDETGYRVRWLRGAGTKQARWRDVEDAVTGSVGGQDCVILRLRDGRTTTIPMRVLDASPSSFLDDLRARLDQGHGYRRLR